MSNNWSNKKVKSALNDEGFNKGAYGDYLINNSGRKIYPGANTSSDNKGNTTHSSSIESLLCFINK